MPLAKLNETQDDVSVVWIDYIAVIVDMCNNTKKTLLDKEKIMFTLSNYEKESN